MPRLASELASIADKRKAGISLICVAISKPEDARKGGILQVVKWHFQLKFYSNVTKLYFCVRSHIIFSSCNNRSNHFVSYVD